MACVAIVWTDNSRPQILCALLGENTGTECEEMAQNILQLPTLLEQNKTKQKKKNQNRKNEKIKHIYILI